MSSPSLSSGARAQDGLDDAARAELEAYRLWMPRIKDLCLAAAAGDLERRLLQIGDVGGQLGATLQALNHLLDLTDNFVREAGAALEYASRGKYFRRVLETGMLGTFRRGAGIINAASHEMEAQSAALQLAKQRQATLADEFETQIEQVVRSVATAADDLQRTAQGLSATAEHTRDRADSVTGAVRVASEGLDTITRASGDLSTVVGDITRQVSAAVSITREAVRESGDASNRAERLSGSTVRIGSVVHLIRQVAQQTNLLALNATIEAARAGEVGRGFAVVASEVKDLSVETRNATEEIEEQVSAIGADAHQMVQSISNVGSILVKLDEISSTIAAAMEQQDAASSEVSKSTQSAASSAHEVLGTMTDVRSAAEETSHSSHQLLDAAGELSRASGSLSRAVAEFLADLREGAQGA